MRAPVTALDLIRWLRWAGEGNDEKEKETRLARVNRYLFPEGLSDAERKERQETSDFVKRWGKVPSWLGFSEPCPPPDEDPNVGRIVMPDIPTLPVPPPVSEEEEWEGLIPPSSKAYRRGSLHDGTHRQVQRMKERARGSPFDAAIDDEEAQRSRLKKKRRETPPVSDDDD